MSSACSRSQQLQMLAILPIERQGEWLNACLLCGGGRDIRIDQVTTPREAAAAIRQHEFDLLVFWHEGSGVDVLDAWNQLAEITGHTGFVSLGMQVVDGWNEPLIDAGAIACLDMDQTEPLTLVNTLRMACELERLRSESQVWAQERHRKREREAREIDRALASQRSLLARLDQFGSHPFVRSPMGAASDGIREPIQSNSTQVDHSAQPLQSPEGRQYLSALQTFIFDENHASSASIAALAEHYARAGAGSSSIMHVHLAAVTQVTAGGGAASLRHCLSGADRFLMELLMRIVDHLGASGTTTDSSSAENVRIHSASSPLAAA